MNHRSFSPDRLHSALHEVGGTARPDYLTDIVAEAGRTRQRPAWTLLERWLPMDIEVRRPGVVRPVALVATLCLLAALLAAGAVSIGSQRAEPGPLPLTERFDSPLHGLSIDYPSGWVTRAATTPWERGALAFDAPEVDVIFDPALGGDLFIAMVSESLDGRAPDDWCCSRRIPTICAIGGGGHSGDFSSSLRGTESSFSSTGGCGPDGGLHSVVAATATRGYIIQVYVGDARIGEVYDWDWFEALLESVDLHPVAP